MKYTEIIFVIDASGSMAHLTGDTIGGFNGFIESQKALDGKATLTTVLFDSNWKILHDGIDIQEVKPLTKEDYVAGGMTAMLDAIGEVINKVQDRHDDLGAEKPEDSGYYFWWGDTVGYKRVSEKWVAAKGYNTNFSFSGDNVPTYGKRISDLESKGWIENKNGTYVLTSKHDAARAHWGGNWRMPTKDEFEDLVSKCDWNWTKRNGVNGYVVRGRGNYASKSIFVPAAGYGIGAGYGLGASLIDGSFGGYWSSVPDSGGGRAYGLYFGSDSHGAGYDYRGLGYSVRPVQGFTK